MAGAFSLFPGRDPDKRDRLSDKIMLKQKRLANFVSTAAA
jgi:hypothetical protein